VTTATLGHLDARTEAYVHDVLRAIETLVPLVEAYLVGSGAAGPFDPRTSDVDLVVVIGEGLGDRRRDLVDRVAAIHCPVRDLELVLYVEGAAPSDVELNVNHGEEEPDADAFWFVLDAALAEEQAVPLRNGIPWGRLFERVPEERVREAVRESLAWSERRDDAFGRMNAVRARHYLEHGEWISKGEAARR
jgi:predicted nucleotidyltransferase